MKRQIHEKIQRKIQRQLRAEKESNFLLNLVFQHLSPKELLNASLVNPNWYKEVGKLKTFSNRLKIKCNRENLDYLLHNSERYYEKVEITVGNSQLEVQQVEDIILKFSSHLKAIKLVKIGGFMSMLNDPLPFASCLTKVEIHAVCGRISCEFLKFVETLRKLTVNGMDPKGLFCCLRNNRHLKELTLYENSNISYFEEDISSNIKFKLKKLAILDHSISGPKLNGEFEARLWKKEMLINFKKFLMTQNCLKSLHFDAFHAANLGKFIKPSIEILEVNNLRGDIKQLKIPSYNNIRVLITNDSTIDLFQITIFPNLQSIYVKHFSSDMLLVKHSQDDPIQNIFFEEQEDDECEWLEDLISLKIKQASKEEFKKLYCNLK